MQARIHFHRFGKGESLYIEPVVSDDGTRLDTCAFVPQEYRHIWTKSARHKKGILPEGQAVHKIQKHHFYQEWFDIIELFDENDQLLGYYCDVITPLKKQDGEYYLQDLLLDLFIFPDGSYQELDWDEFAEAVQKEMISADLQQKAVATLRRMVAEVRQGIFPGAYLPNGSTNDGGKEAR